MAYYSLHVPWHLSDVICSKSCQVLASILGHRSQQFHLEAFVQTLGEAEIYELFTHSLYSLGQVYETLFTNC